MENREQQIDLSALAKAVWAQKRKLMRWGIVGLIVGLVVAFSLPKEYQSTIKIAPETKAQGGSMSQLGGFAAMMGVSMSGSGEGGVDESLYPEIIKSGPFLAEFATIKVPFNGEQITLENYLNKEQKKTWWSTVLGAPIRFLGWVFTNDNKEQEQTEDAQNPSNARRAFEVALTNRMTVEAEKKAGLITLQVLMQNPSIALLVTDSLYAKLSRYMSDYHTSKARYDLKNSEELLAQAKVQYYKADSEYALAVDQNRNLISKSAQIKVDRYQNERDLAYMVYQQLAQQVESNKIVLQQDTPIATVIEPARMPNIPTLPNKKMIIIALTLLGVFATASVVVARTISKSN